MQRQHSVVEILKRATRRGVVVAASGVVVSVLGLGLAVGSQACSSDAKDSTSGKRVLLHTRVEVNEVAKQRFKTNFGWDVTLSKALVSAGPFYYFDGAPPLVSRERHDSFQYAARLLGLGTAQAHPGHYQAGNALGQLLESSSLDLLAGGVDFPDGDGVTGTYRSARFTFSPASGPAKKQLGANVALAEGVAEKDGGEPRYFHAVAELSALEEDATDGQVEGCEFHEVDVDGDGTVTVTINPKIWFDLVDFSEAEQASLDTPAEFAADSQPQIAFVLGVTQLSAYKFSYSKP